MVGTGVECEREGEYGKERSEGIAKKVVRSGSPIEPPCFHLTFMLFLVVKIRELYPETDGNYVGFKRTRVEEMKSLE